MQDNYYHILGLENFASKEAIKNAYRKLAKKYHPDRNPGHPQLEEQFKLISRAYHILSDPVKKQQFDYQLLAPRTPRQRPRYSRPATYYSREKRQYTPMAWMYGKIFIILFVMAVVLIPLALIYRSSVNSYEKGMEAYHKGNHYEALTYFNRAITLFGGGSEGAAIKAAEICIYEQKDYKQALYFINRGLKYAEKQDRIARLYYLKALTFRGLERYDEASQSLLRADSLHFPHDSIQLQLGLLNAFSLNNCDQARTNFNYLIRRNSHLETAWFGKGWCEYNQRMYDSAVSSYSRVIAINPDNSVAWYFRGINFLSMEDSTAACNDLYEAMQLGYSRAEGSFEHYCMPPGQ